MSTLEAPPPSAVAAARAVPEPRTAVPVKWWAGIGALILAFEFWILGKWITGEHFERVPTGASDPPDWMSAVLASWEIITFPLVAGTLYWFLVRPYIKERKWETDGLLCIAFLLLSWQDPFSSYFGHWFTYNTYLFNRGSWAYELPGWQSYGTPGAEIASPLIVFTGLYVYVFLGLSIAGCAVMRKVRARWPQSGNFGLVAACYATMCVACVVVEGLIYMPLGFYTYAGGKWDVIGAGTYHQVPLHQILVFGALFTSMATLRFFKNDRGETFAERGLDRIAVSPGRRAGLRLLAICGFVQVAMFFTYNLPTMFIGANSDPWPKENQERSYFNSGICGGGTPRPCPGQGVPLLQDKLTNGNPAIPPLDRGKPGD